MTTPSTASTIPFDDYEVSAAMSPISVASGPVTLSFDDDAAEVVTDVTFTAAMLVSHVDEPRPVMATGKSHLMDTDGWTWQQLRDYVVDAITSATGAFPRNPVTEAAIFKSFLERWGDKAELIARQAVEVHQCWWRSAPLSVQRFCKGSDPYFSEIIAATV